MRWQRFQRALEAVIGWEEPAFDNARYWCQRAVDWDHEPAKRLFALMHEHGWGGPVDAAAAAKWNAAARDQRQQGQKQRQRKEEAGSPGGLSLAPVERTSPAAAPVVWTGSPLRDMVGWFAREGNPHAAFHMGTLDEHGRDGSVVDLALARDWYAQAAEAGHADGTYNLGVAIENGTGGPADRLMAQALFMLANTRGTTVRVDQLRIAAHEQGPVRALVAALREPDRLRAVLREKGLQASGGAGHGGVGRAVAGVAAGAAVAGLSGTDWGRAGGGAAMPPPPANRAPNRIEEDDDGDEEEGRGAAARYRSQPVGRGASPAGVSLHLGHLALAIGAASVVLLIAFVKPGSSFKTGMLVLSLVAAFGAWRTGRDFGWAPAARAMVAVAAAIPVMGMAVCIWMLMRSFRGRN